MTTAVSIASLINPCRRREVEAYQEFTCQELTSGPHYTCVYRGKDSLRMNGLCISNTAYLLARDCLNGREELGNIEGEVTRILKKGLGLPLIRSRLDPPLPEGTERHEVLKESTLGDVKKEVMGLVEGGIRVVQKFKPWSSSRSRTNQR